MREIFRHGAVYGVSSLTLAVVELISTPALTRIFGTIEYGTRELITNALAFLLPLTLIGFDFSFPAQYMTERERGRGRRFLSTSFLSVALWALLLVSALAALDLTLVQWPSGRTSLVFVVALLGAVPSALVLMTRWALRFRFEPGRSAAIAILGGIGSAALGLIGAVVTHDLLGLYIGQLVGFSMAAIIGISFLAGEIGLVFDRPMFKEAVRLGLPFTPATILAVAFLYVDRQILAVLAGLDSVGVYALGWRIASVPALLVVVLNTAWLPIAIREFARPETFRSLLAGALRYTCVVLGLVSVGLTALAPEILRLLAPPPFAGAAVLVAPLTLAAVFQAVGAIVGVAIVVRRKPALGLLANAAAFIANGVIGLLLVPQWGGLGAASGVLAGSIVVAAGYALALRPVLPLTALPLSKLGATIGLTAAGLAIGAALSGAPLLLRVLLLLAYTAFLALTRIVDLSEYRLLFKFIGIGAGQPGAGRPS
jgi:O-antigen/teichoic acid export membrane protein